MQSKQAQSEDSESDQEENKSSGLINTEDVNVDLPVEESKEPEESPLEFGEKIDPDAILEMGSDEEIDNDIDAQTERESVAIQ